MPTLVEAQSLCRDWRVYRPEPGDKLTPTSAKELLASNEARVVWGCKRLENEAGS